VKQSSRLFAVLALTVILIAAFLVLRSRESGTQSTDQVIQEDFADRSVVFEHRVADIARIVVESHNHRLEIAQNTDRRFDPVYEFDVAFNNVRVNEIVSRTVLLTSNRVIGAVEYPSEFGLDEPEATVDVELVDGTINRLVIGSMTPARDAFFVQIFGEPSVYVVAENHVRPFFETLDSLRTRSIPRIDFPFLQRIAIDTLAGRTVRVERVPAGDPNPELRFAPFAVYQPYRQPFGLSADWLVEVETVVPDLRIERFVNDSPDNPADYALAPPAARVLIADSTRTVEFLVGSETHDGRYARFPDSDSVFVLSGIEPLVTVDPYRTISPFVLIANINIVDAFRVRTQSASFSGQIDRTANTPVYYLNGNPVDESTFRELYRSVIGLQLDAEIPPETRPSEAGISARQPVLSLSIELSDNREPLTVSFVPWNASFAAAVREGYAEFLISHSSINRLIQTFEQAVRNHAVDSER